MRDAAGELADRIHLLGLAKPLLCLVLRGEVGCRTAIAHEASVGGEDRLAVDAEMAHASGNIAAAILELPERLVAVEHRHVLAPFLRLGIVIEGGIAPALADHGLAVHAEGAGPVRYVGEHVIRSGLPEPVGCGLGIVAEALLARARVLFGAPADLQVTLE